MLFGIFWIEIDQSHLLSDYRPLFMLVVLTLGIILCLLSIRPIRKNPALLQQRRYLSTKERIYTAMHLGPLCIVFFLCMILMIIEVIF